MQPTVSIIIPVFNIENYIENCVESVRRQSFDKLEIICVDDGSTDSSARKIKELSFEDCRIKYLYQCNAGVAAARNAGLDAANGEYVCFLDGDDYLHPQAIETLLDCAEKTKADMVCADYKITESSCEKSESFTDYTDSDIGFDALFFKGNKLGKTCVAKLIRTQAAKKARFFEGIAMGEDGCYILMLLAENISVRYIDKELYYYFVRQGSATKSVLNEKKLTIVNAYDMLCDKLKSSQNSQIRAFALRSVFYQLNQKRRLYKGTDFENLSEETCKRIGRKHLKAFLKEKNISPKIKLIHTLRFFFVFIK